MVMLFSGTHLAEHCGDENVANFVAYAKDIAIHQSQPTRSKPTAATKFRVEDYKYPYARDGDSDRTTAHQQVC